MRTRVSTIGTVPYGTSKYLVETIQPILSKNIHRVINSYTFVQEAKTWEIYEDEVQVSYDVVNLYPSVPVDKAINVFIGTLNHDKEHLKERTNLTLTDIHKLMELCLTALTIQIFLLRQRNADAKQLFLYLRRQNTNLLRQFLFTYLRLNLL